MEEEEKKEEERQRRRRRNKRRRRKRRRRKRRRRRRKRSKRQRKGRLRNIKLPKPEVTCHVGIILFLQEKIGKTNKMVKELNTATDNVDLQISKHQTILFVYRRAPFFSGL